MLKSIIERSSGFFIFVGLKCLISEPKVYFIG
jgi:hypothetical protein